MIENGKISVLMGIYNCENTLKQAVKSIKNQTYSNWELILCDDGSHDRTWEIANEMAETDPRIIVLRNENNMGLNATLNRCLACATGEFVARMDGDDECLNERFEKQIDFLNHHKEYAIVSSPMILFDDDGEWGITRSIEKPTVEDVVCGSPICHAPVMLRRECMNKVNGYTEDKKMLRVEDVNLWIKLYASGYRCYNLQEPLYRMRNDKNALKRRKYKYRINSTYVRLQGCRILRLGIRCYLKSFIPMVNGLVPARLRHFIRKHQRFKI